MCLFIFEPLNSLLNCSPISTSVCMKEWHPPGRVILRIRAWVANVYCIKGWNWINLSANLFISIYKILCYWYLLFGHIIMFTMPWMSDYLSAIVVLNAGNFDPKGIFSNVWNLFLIFITCGCCWCLLGRGQECANHPAMHKTGLLPKNYPV